MQSAARERVLLVDDEPQVLVALSDLLGDEFNVVALESAEAALDMLSREHDIAVLITDQRMPKMSGDELLSKLGQNSSRAVPILVTGFADLSAVIRAVNEGKIFAYVTKPWNSEDLRMKVFQAAEHFKLARELANERQLLHSILASMGEGVIVADQGGKFLLFNGQAEKILGGGPGNASASEWADTCGAHFGDQKTRVPALQNPLLRAMSGEEIKDTELFVQNKVIHGAIVSVTATPLKYNGGSPDGGIAVIRDVTLQRRLEEQLAQSQKMDAIGRLAGGVAHDFNNLLAVIKSYGALVLEELPEGDSKREDLGQMLEAAQRAATLTKQLLAFSRHQAVQPKALQLNEVVSNIEKMLRRIIGEDVCLLTALSPTLGMIRADASQIEQIILNLTINARDAMPDGGNLTIETANIVLDREYTQSHAGVSPGEFVMMAVTDTGHGMDANTQRRIFEPFFTTKEVGKGTGLGLATVYGIAQQGGGHVGVYSEVGRGTCFKVYFPRVQGRVDSAAQRPTSELPAKATGTVLIVEDDGAVRRVAVRILRGRGYTVLESTNADEARRLCANGGDSIDLLLTDVVMPGISGPRLAEELRRACPRMRVLYMSGYTGAAVVNDGLLPAGTAYVEKPFTPDSLSEKVREVIADPYYGA